VLAQPLEIPIRRERTPVLVVVFLFLSPANQNNATKTSETTTTVDGGEEGEEGTSSKSASPKEQKIQAAE
jgi:hypothetical protein